MRTGTRIHVHHSIQCMLTFVLQCGGTVHKGCFVKSPEGAWTEPKGPWTCALCLTSRQSSHLVATASADAVVAADDAVVAADDSVVAADVDNKQLVYTSQAALDTAVCQLGFVVRSSRRNQSGTTAVYYICKTCNALASSKNSDECYWTLTVPSVHTCATTANAVGVVATQRALPKIVSVMMMCECTPIVHDSLQVLAKIRELSASGAFCTTSIQEHIKHSLYVDVSTDLLYRIGYNLRLKLFGDGGDHGHLVQLQQERRKRGDMFELVYSNNGSLHYVVWVACYAHLCVLYFDYFLTDATHGIR